MILQIGFKMIAIEHVRQNPFYLHMTLNCANLQQLFQIIMVYVIFFKILIHLSHNIIKFRYPGNMLARE